MYHMVLIHNISTPTCDAVVSSAVAQPTAVAVAAVQHQYLRSSVKWVECCHGVSVVIIWTGPGGGDQVQAGATGHGHHAAPSQHHPLCWPSLPELCCTGACFTLLCKKINTFLSSLSLNLRNNFALSTCDVLWWVCAAVECCWVLLCVVVQAPAT